MFLGLWLAARATSNENLFVWRLGLGLFFGHLRQERLIVMFVPVSNQTAMLLSQFTTANNSVKRTAQSYALGSLRFAPAAAYLKR